MKKAEIEKEPSPKDLNRLLEWVNDHPLAQKIIEEKRGEIRQKRRAVIEEIKRLEAEYQPKKKDLTAAAKQAEAGWKEAREDLLKAELSLGQANWNLRDETGTFQTRIALLKNILRDTASPLIDDFIADMQTMYDKVRHDIRESTFDGVKTDIFTLQRKYILRTNIRAVERCMSYIREVIQKAEALRFTDQPENLEEMFDSWRSNIPSIETMEEVETYYR